MTVVARYDLSDKRVKDLFDSVETDVYLPDDGEGVALITNFNNVAEITNHYCEYVVGESLDVLVHEPTAIPAVAPEIIADAKVHVDNIAENKRQAYLTSGEGQALTYLRKEADAQAYKDAGYPVIGDPIEYPWVSHEATATGTTPQEAADDILANRDVWVIAGGLIEEVRRKAKVDLNSAVNQRDVDLIISTTQTDMDAIG